MSSHSYENICPVCKEQMSCCCDYSPFDFVSGDCIHCGFSYYTKVEQMSLEDINYQREEHNEGMEYTEKDEEYLKPLKQKDLNRYKKEIETFY